MIDWPHIWLNESFATYSDALYHEHAIGFDYLRALMESYSYTDYEGSIYDPVYLFDRIVYTKGAFVLHMLRRTVGTETFWQILKTWYQDPRFAYGNASTSDFVETCETVSGQELDWFFQQWIYGTSRPSIQYNWDYSESTSGTGYTTTIQLDQVQENLPLFKILMDVQLSTGDETITESIWLENSSHSLEIHSLNPPLQIVLDPDSWALAYKIMDPDQFQFETGAKLPQAKFGEQYTATLELKGGQAPYALSVISGELPPGITLDLETGDFKGFPLETGKFNFTVRASDSRTLTRYTQRTFTLKALSPQAEATLTANQSEYSAGDLFTTTLSIHSYSEETLMTRLYMLLEIDGIFFFLDPMAVPFPSFTEEVAFLELAVEPELELSLELLSIPLPSPLMNLTGAWWCFLLNSETGAGAGPLSVEPFVVKE